jgi:hypothetical protein
VFLHYLVWRNRLPLGDRITVSDEIDLWARTCSASGSPVSRRRPDDHRQREHDFDAYYDGLRTRAGAEPPRKFLPDPSAPSSAASQPRVRQAGGRRPVFVSICRSPSWRLSTRRCAKSQRRRLWPVPCRWSRVGFSYSAYRDG